MPQKRKANEEPQVEGHVFKRKAIDEDAQPTPENADPQVRTEGGEDEGPEVEGHIKLKK